MKHATRLRLIACLFFALAAMAARTDDDLVLEDQFGTEFAFEGPHEQAFAIVYADRAASKLTKPWREFLEAYAETVLVIGAANLDSAPRMARPFIRKAFDKAPPTLLDWKGELAARYGFTPKVPNIYVFDRRGELLGALSGQGSESELAALRTLLERV